MTEALVCFKAYDIRGRVPEDLNEDIAYRIGRAYARFLRPSKVVVGHDIRLSSPAIMGALIEGLRDEGSDVYQIGQIGTEEIYFSTFAHNMDGGIAVTASHNPKNWNGMKFVREGSKPISGDTGLKKIQALAQANDFGEKAATPGKLLKLDHLTSYLDHLLSYVQADKLQPLKIVVNAGNGGAGAIIDALEPLLPFEFIKLQHQADGNFPNGVPNPLLVENREITAKAIVEHNADLGIAWDGDFDRCFFFDHQGRFIEGYYIVGLLADAFLAKHKQASIVHDPRLTWNTQAIVERAGGKAVCSKTGHAFIKERMRLEDAVYGGEMSAHHYFKDFAYCDSGMIPWLLITELMQAQNCTLASMVDDRMALFPASGEINRRVDDAGAMIAMVEQQYAGDALRIDRTDGLSIEYEQWRFNLRSSNTEPVVRLNVESRADTALMQQKTEDLLVLVGGEPA